MSHINIAGLDKSKILIALYNGSKQQGLGFLHNATPITIEEANALLKEQTYFDYLKGKVMKIELSQDEMRTDLCNRDIGENAAENIINKLREENQ